MASDSTKKGLIIYSIVENLKTKKEELIQLNSVDYIEARDLIVVNEIISIFDEIIITLESNILSNKSSEIPLDFDEKYIAFIANSIDIRKVNADVKAVDFKGNLYEILDLISKIKSYLTAFFSNKKIIAEKNAAAELIKDIEGKVNDVKGLVDQNKLLSEDLRNRTIHQIYDEDSKKFKKTARLYEIAFYILLLLLAFYLFGYHFEINTHYITFKLAEHFDDTNKTAFYIQKISLIILSSTLAAFLLKRSFMNRRLADEAYRTAKEIDGLPRYMVGLPEEMKEKIRFDLAYKYFGNGIHHESYSGGENLMHENMKANTDFIMAVKDLNKPSDDKANSEGK
ncbi:hypothetical protein PWJ64_05495 [Acinetobacter nosocomialis]|uniref:hypothetical protein n=1 Tax=Acinetobacter nosocomialis TaxID=106654 RepID=UPI001AE6FEC6|nr:hypothetical protein [Acinetobacter nosocomialis]MBP1501810.1 hypothetical protein [Acinetobacter nosocomialis]MDE1706108.1 hypothetical protein [Acinetobacter nosocomialis]HDG9765201.1 hypothetical protein [Acinetobacter nosocomialis]